VSRSKKKEPLPQYQDLIQNASGSMGDKIIRIVTYVPTLFGVVEVEVSRGRFIQVTGDMSFSKFKYNKQVRG